MSDNLNSKNAGREEFARLVNENKENLFGKFSSKLTHEAKKGIWIGIKAALVNRGAMEFANKGERELRTMWYEMKRRALERSRKRKQTGEGKVELSAVDNIVIESIGRESAAVVGLQVADSEHTPYQGEVEYGKKPMKSSLLSRSPSTDSEDEEINVGGPIDTELTQSITPSTKFMKASSSRESRKEQSSSQNARSFSARDMNTQESLDIARLRYINAKTELMRLQCEKTKREIRLMDMDIFSREMDGENAFANESIANNEMIEYNAQ